MDAFYAALEQRDDDEAFLERTGTEGLFQPPKEAAVKLKRDIEAELLLTAFVGVATRKFLAKIGTDLRKPRGHTVVPPGEERAFLAPLPIERLCGVGPTTAKKHREMGLVTLGDVARQDPSFLEHALGALGAHIFRLAQALDAVEARFGKGALRRAIGGAAPAQSSSRTGSLSDRLRPNE